jgi:hypothetical protein
LSLVRVRPAEWLAAVAGAVLFASLFIVWYEPHGIPVPPGATGYAPLPAPTGWQAFSVLDIVLTVLATSGLLLLVVQASWRSPAVPSYLSVATVLAGAAATIIVVVRLLVRPEETGLGAGAWIGLAGALGLLVCGWWSMGTEHVRGMPAPAVEARPAPPPGG